MQVQLKKGILDICVLGALVREDSYGYKIVKDLSPYFTVSESTLYPILRRLETGGMLTVYTVEHNSRLRKYYSITEEGKNRIREFKNEWKDLMKMYEFIEREFKENE